MKVVLVRPPFYALFGVTTPKMKTYPLNLLYLATFLRERSPHEAAIVDGESVSIPELGPQEGLAEDPEIIMNKGIPKMVGLLEDPDHPLWEEIERRILNHSPDLVGITCNSGNMDTARLLVGRLKRRGIPVILGGSHPTVLPEQSIAYTGADMIAMGEGELTLRSVMDLISRRADFAEIPSLAWKDNGRIRVNPRGDLIADINELPLPDRSLIRRSDYFGEVVMTGRGCPFDCAYCASRNIWGKRVRLRSVESVIDELEILKKEAEESKVTERPGKRATGVSESRDQRPGIWVVKIVDDTFTVNRKRTIDLLDEIVARGLNRFEFTGGVRADTLDELVVGKLRAANFRRVTLGVESGSPRILSMIRKGETNEDVKRAVRLLREAGIHSHAFFMIGLPGETLEDIELTKKLILEVRPDHVEINMVTPYPGTDIFSKLIPEDPLKIDRWYRWFHQGMATHSDLLGYDLDKTYKEFLDFAKEYHESGNQ
ncbi:MAG TPA: radical SAM protein [Desulfomonilaceae bacterium]|nr:radical SAM protein [Desulfomonilaceae bacterium]